MYGKLFESTYEGSMFGAGAHVHALWAYVVARTKDGHVELNPDLAAAVIGMPVEDVERALEYLMAPDPRSRNKDEEGRRMIREGAFLYRVVSHEHYRNIRNDDDRRAYNREAKRRERERQQLSMTVNDTQRLLPSSAQSEAEAEAETIRSSSGSPTLPAQVREVFEHWVRVMGKDASRTRLTKDRRTKIQARLRDDGYSVAELKLAIDGCRRDRWHMGENNDHKPYNDLTTIMKSGSSVEKHRDNAVGSSGTQSKPRLHPTLQPQPKDPQ